MGVPAKYCSRDSVCFRLVWLKELQPSAALLHTASSLKTHGRSFVMNSTQRSDSSDFGSPILYHTAQTFANTLRFSCYHYVMSLPIDFLDMTSSPQYNDQTLPRVSRLAIAEVRRLVSEHNFFALLYCTRSIVKVFVMYIYCLPVSTTQISSDSLKYIHHLLLLENTYTLIQQLQSVSGAYKIQNMCKARSPYYKQFTGIH